MNRLEAIQYYWLQLQELESYRGELAEIQKAELEAKVNGYNDSSGNTTDRRNSGSFAARDLTSQRYDLECDIQVRVDRISYIQTILPYLESSAQSG